MDSITINGIEFLPHTFPLVFGLGGLWILCAASTIVWGLCAVFKLLR